MVRESRELTVSDDTETLLRACLGHLRIQTRLMISREMFGKEFMMLDPMDKLAVEQTMQAWLCEDQPLGFLNSATPPATARNRGRESGGDIGLHPVRTAMEAIETSIAQIAKARASRGS